MRRLLLVLVAMGLSTLWATPAGADAPSRQPGGASVGNPSGTFPAGVVCTFPVSFGVVSGGEGQLFTFIDHNGHVVRLMNHAKPSVWFFTNLDSGASYTLKLPAGLDRIAPSADGTTTVTISGGAIGFNAPTDTPPGPFALTNVGHLIFVIAPDGTGTLTKLSGKQTDLCAAVGP
jgi:hypothetical protein